MKALLIATTVAAPFSIAAGSADKSPPVLSILPSESQFMVFNLFDGADAMLHGYVPKEGDAVEFYMRDVHCAEPTKLCSFELAIRKKP
jgi:hypothetical protein